MNRGLQSRAGSGGKPARYPFVFILRTPHARRDEPTMNALYLRAFALFAALRILSLSLHFMGDNPYGEPVVLNPDRFLPNAAFHEAGLIMAWCLILASLDAFLVRSPTGRSGTGRAGTIGPHGSRGSAVLRALCLLGGCLYIGFCQIDNEVVRWMGEHINVSFLCTYFGFRDSFMWGRVIKADWLHFLIAALLMAAPWYPAWRLWRRRDADRALGTAWAPVALVLSAVFISFPFWFHYSDKRWRRIRPAPWGIIADTWKGFAGQEEPRNRLRAYSDLIAMVRTGKPSSTDLAAIPAYPLLDSDNLGSLSPEAFKALPLDQRPNIVLLIVETLRGWKTGLVDDPSMPSQTPHLDSVLLSEGLCFPWTHSNGFPSVEGGIGIHLGLWPHFRRTFISDYIHVRSRSIPEGLRLLGYRSEILFGYDPSFDNFTPWLRKWYDRYEYDPSRRNDGPLIDRLMSIIDTLPTDRPFMTALWTTTMHPPFDVPADAGYPPAKDADEAYNQAIGYTEKHILRLFKHLKERPDFKRTLVILVGDHSDYTAWQMRNTEVVGELNPGHTWTNLAFWGGWPGLGPRGRREETVSQIDIAPTLFTMLNARFPNHFIGRSLLQPSQRDILCMRYGHLALISEASRTVFHMEADSIWHWDLDKHRKIDYALLEGNTAQATRAAPPGFDPERYRDMARAYGRVLDRDALLPPDPGR
ncbi:MAG: sulfatase domain protein [Fibrobacteres bacterium]|nr:sulfatase domain protein [Fibrobacterota bacterium]